MKIAIFTGNAIRHKYLANTLIKNVDDAIVICGCKPNDATDIEGLGKNRTLLEEHFYKRYQTEVEMFKGNEFINGKVLPIFLKEANLKYVYNVIKDFQPDAMFVFGACIIKEPLLSLLPPGNFINLHLGISPYYLGHGTNFWPFVNKELEYVGSTIMHIDAGIDTGDVIEHVRPNFEANDNVHTIGCKVIKDSTDRIVKIINKMKEGEDINRVKQWYVRDAKYYRKKDITEEVLQKYQNNIKEGLIEEYLNKPKKELKLINF